VGRTPAPISWTNFVRLIIIAELQPTIRTRRLQMMLTLPTLAATDRRSGLMWIIGNYGHAREHLGHIQLTRQLLLAITTDP